jgi:hypothetical protein
MPHEMDGHPETGDKRGQLGNVAFGREFAGGKRRAGVKPAEADRDRAQRTTDGLSLSFPKTVITERAVYEHDWIAGTS